MRDPSSCCGTIVRLHSLGDMSMYKIALALGLALAHLPLVAQDPAGPHTSVLYLPSSDFTATALERQAKTELLTHLNSFVWQTDFFPEKRRPQSQTASRWHRAYSAWKQDFESLKRQACP